ncbi:MULTISPECIES: hypothetical protein [unclassified Streptomyces]|uniref:hypothetical protein n=1 Tax=unclassified Streptomyces TaxID=2593676 RepID=UPI001BE7D617|nr:MULTISPECIES: hypothetical protein [unclassified Streptomyces]MBT2408123.1 hypothetical protein [Streptomyces sp. ISL-21]MBT2613331.1 hypothetical protein [Streptomyces sp. ISL-87]
MTIAPQPSEAVKPRPVSTPEPLLFRAGTWHPLPAYPLACDDHQDWNDVVEAGYVAPVCEAPFNPRRH